MAKRLISGLSCHRGATAVLEYFTVIDADPVRDEEDQIINWAGLINSVLLVWEV